MTENACGFVWCTYFGPHDHAPLGRSGDGWPRNFGDAVRREIEEGCAADAAPPQGVIAELVRVLDDAYPAQASDSLRHKAQMGFLALAVAKWLDSRKEWRS